MQRFFIFFLVFAFTFSNIKFLSQSQNFQFKLTSATSAFAKGDEGGEDGDGDGDGEGDDKKRAERSKGGGGDDDDKGGSKGGGGGDGGAIFGVLAVALGIGMIMYMQKQKEDEEKKRQEALLAAQLAAQQQYAQPPIRLASAGSIPVLAGRPVNGLSPVQRAADFGLSSVNCNTMKSGGFKAQTNLGMFQIEGDNVITEYKGQRKQFKASLLTKSELKTLNLLKSGSNCQALNTKVKEAAVEVSQLREAEKKKDKAKETKVSKGSLPAKKPRYQAQKSSSRRISYR